ncbi:hemin uptake protein HemP [Caldichromatium japonicum]|uniref:Hemin uptake protein HemP n=1 Tax=Caldichromatium japonicum TaxID=2699430 RepID=A0A6G7VC80_9GAMM|nr:hemin uptake protein HemP [Caldichromatium japonicum]QIK37458.1 hemin uptake protein HemP [Caldichromatium japonicum]
MQATATHTPTLSTEPDRQCFKAPPIPRIDSRTLLGDGHLLVIEHAGQSYYLRMTRNNKLILTK